MRSRIISVGEYVLSKIEVPAYSHLITLIRKQTHNVAHRDYS